MHRCLVVLGVAGGALFGLGFGGFIEAHSDQHVVGVVVAAALLEVVADHVLVGRLESVWTDPADLGLRIGKHLGTFHGIRIYLEHTSRATQLYYCHKASKGMSTSITGSGGLQLAPIGDPLEGKQYQFQIVREQATKMK